MITRVKAAAAAMALAAVLSFGVAPLIATPAFAQATPAKPAKPAEKKADMKKKAPAKKASAEKKAPKKKMTKKTT